MKAEAGTTIVWRGQRVEVLVVRPLAALLRDTNGDEIEVSIDELNRTAQPCESQLRTDGLRAIAEMDELPVEVRAWKKAIDDIILARQTYGQTAKIVGREAEHLSKELGRSVSVRTVYRQLKAYEDHGLVGLIDQRNSEMQARLRRVDPRVVEAINKVLGGRARASTVSKTALIEKVRLVVAADYGDDVESAEQPNDAPASQRRGPGALLLRLGKDTGVVVAGAD